MHLCIYARMQRGHLLRAGLILRPMRSQVVGSKTLNSTKVTHIVHASMFGKLTMEAIRALNCV